MSGIFNLSNAIALRDKLRRDLGKLKAQPVDADAAFNFFVTAEHMLDWIYPGKANQQKRTEAREKSALLRVCSHLATGAKHFVVEYKHHDSVDATALRSGYATAYATPYATNYAGLPTLVVTLKGVAATELGQKIGVIQLAEKVLDFWDNHALS
jgi:hypothetical protein